MNQSWLSKSVFLTFKGKAINISTNRLLRVWQTGKWPPQVSEHRSAGITAQALAIADDARSQRCLVKMQKEMPCSLVSRKDSPGSCAALICGTAVRGGLCGSQSMDGPSVYFGLRSDCWWRCWWIGSGLPRVSRWRWPAQKGVSFCSWFWKSGEDQLMRHQIQCSRFRKEKMKWQTCLQPSLEANDSEIVQVDQKCEWLTNTYWQWLERGKR